MTQQTKVGILVVIALAIFMVGVFVLGQQEHLWERKVPYEVHFARTNGLAEGAQVSLNGVPIGSVSDMRFPADPTANYIVVTVKVAEDAAPRVRENTVATIRTLGLLGDRYIELGAGSPDSPPVQPGGLIASLDPVDYEAVLGQSGDIVTNVVQVSASLRSVLQSIERGEGLLGAMLRNRELGESTLVDLQRTMANIQKTSGSLEAVLKRVNRGEGLLGRFTKDDKESQELWTRLNRSVKSLDELTNRLSEGHGTVARLVGDEEYAQRVLGHLDSTLTDLSSVAAKIDRGQGTAAKVINDPALYDEAKGLVGGARRSWLLGLYRGVTGLWPFGGDEAPAKAPVDAPSP